MGDLIEASIHSILRQMSPANLSTYIKFVTSNYYGKHGERILTAAKAMLCREGYEMHIRYFDGITGDIVREIIGSDGFYIPGEWERWLLAKRVLNRRLKTKAIETGVMNLDGKLLKPRPASLGFTALRFDAVYRNASGITSASSGDMERWLGLYTHPDIAPLLVLIDEGIHYMHMSFEQLQIIRQQRDTLGVRLVTDQIISNALWMSMELRQKILNTNEAEMELGLAHEIEPGDETPSLTGHITPLIPIASPNIEMSEKAAGKRPLEQDENERDEEIDSDSWDGNAKPRKFWIPTSDATYPMGSPPELSPSWPNSRGWQSRITSSLDPTDLQWATDFAATTQGPPDTLIHPTVANAPSPEVTYTNFPPFRFSAEFPPAKSLKENKRVYSNTVWYAGSLWNIYVQKKETSKSTQLGIYLHRAKHIEGSDDLAMNQNHGFNSVDEHISSIERELLIRRQGPRRHVNDPRPFPSTEAIASNDSTLVSRPHQDLDTISGLFRPSSTSITKASEASLLGSSTERRFNTTGAFNEDDQEDIEVELKRSKVPTVPAYVDSRSTIKTYFKIFTPSKGGRMLSVYESAPDKFNFSQSWGWKSSNLVLDDGPSMGEERGTAREPRLRFMVVIGERIYPSWNTGLIFSRQCLASGFIIAVKSYPELDIQTSATRRPCCGMK